MYNNIGLMTPRGSGTSGYVQKNLSKMRRVNNRDDFIKELQTMKDNVIDARRKANPEILLHEQKRDIEVKKLQLREELEKRGEVEADIDIRVNKLEQRLYELLNAGRYNLKKSHASDTHARTKQKEQQEKKFNDAFQITEYKPGSAFDFDGQEKERLEKKYERELKKAEFLIQLKEKKKLEKQMIKDESIAKKIKKEKKDKKEHKSSK